MTARSSGLLALIALLLPSAVLTAPLVEHNTEMESYYPVADATGCYYNFHHYDEGDRIITNELCLNCTCHNRMLMCYLRVCPFIKAIGENCKIEKRSDQCCPVIICPEVPVKLLTSTTETSASSEVGHLDKYGCSIDKLFYADGARVPSNPNKPCELCYCIRNKTACVMQECTLHIEGCKPVYQEGVCCPVKYDCDHPEDSLSETTISPTPTTGLVFTTTLLPGVSSDCIHNGEIYADGALIKKETACEHCYCMKGDIVCAVQECGPTPLDKVNCTALPPAEGKCCPDTYDCEYVSEQELTTTYYELTTQAAVKHEEENLITEYTTTELLLTKGHEYEKETKNNELLQPTELPASLAPEIPKKELPGEESEIMKPQTEFIPTEETQTDFVPQGTKEPEEAIIPEVLTEQKYLTTEAVQPVQTTVTYEEDESPTVLPAEHETHKEVITKEPVGTETVPSETTALPISITSGDIEPQKSIISNTIGIIPSEGVNESIVPNEIEPIVEVTTTKSEEIETEIATEISVNVPEKSIETIKTQPESGDQRETTIKSTELPYKTTIREELTEKEEINITTQKLQVNTAILKIKEEAPATDKPLKHTEDTTVLEEGSEKLVTESVPEPTVIPESTETVPELKPFIKGQPTESATETEQIETETEITYHKPLESASHEATTQKVIEKVIHPSITAPESTETEAFATELPPEAVTEFKQLEATEPATAYSVATETKLEVTKQTAIEPEKSSTEETTERELITSLSEHEHLPEGALHDVDHPEEPETPEESEIPEEPITYEEPETHKEQETPEEPESHEKPETYEEPITHEKPEIHEEQEIHEIPEGHKETHEEPEVYAKPETHDEPKAHEKPETHEEPETHEKPETHEEPMVHEKPEIHEEPEAHEKPETHDEPETQEIPKTHEEAESHKKPETHEEPVTYKESETPETEESETHKTSIIHEEPVTYKQSETPETHEEPESPKEPETEEKPVIHKESEIHEEPEESTEYIVTTQEPEKKLEQTEITSLPSEEKTEQFITPQISETHTEKEITTEGKFTVEKSHATVESESSTEIIESDVTATTETPIKSVEINDIEASNPESVQIPEELTENITTQTSFVELTTEQVISKSESTPHEETPVAEVETETPESVIAENEITEPYVVPLKPVTEIPEIVEHETKESVGEMEENEITEKTTAFVEQEKTPLVSEPTEAEVVTEATKRLPETESASTSKETLLEELTQTPDILLETTEAKQPEIKPTEPPIIITETSEVKPYSHAERTTEQMEIVTEISDHTVKTMIALDHVTESEPRVPAKTVIEQEPVKPEIIQACDETTGCAPSIHEIPEIKPELPSPVAPCTDDIGCIPEKKVPVDEIHKVAPEVQQCESGVDCGQPPQVVPEIQPCTSDNLSEDCKNVQENEILQDCVNGDCKYSSGYPDKSTIELTTSIDEYDRVTEAVIIEHSEKEKIPHEIETERPTEPSDSMESIPVISEEITQKQKDEEKFVTTSQYAAQTEPTTEKQKIAEIKTENPHIPHVIEHEPISPVTGMVIPEKKIKEETESSQYSTESAHTVSESATENEEPKLDEHITEKNVVENESSTHPIEEIQTEQPGLIEQSYVTVPTVPETETKTSEEEELTTETQQALTPDKTAAEGEKLQHHLIEEDTTEPTKPVRPEIQEGEIETKRPEVTTTFEQLPEQEMHTVHQVSEETLTTVKYLPEELASKPSETSELSSVEAETTVPVEHITKVPSLHITESILSSESTELEKEPSKTPEKSGLTEPTISETTASKEVGPTEPAVSESQTENIQPTELPEKAEQQMEYATLKSPTDDETRLDEHLPAVDRTTLSEHLMEVAEPTESVSEKLEEPTMKIEIEAVTEILGVIGTEASKPSEQPEVTSSDVVTEADIKPDCEGDCVKEHPSVTESVVSVPEGINEICKEETECTGSSESTEKTNLQTEDVVTPSYVQEGAQQCLDHECKYPVENVIPGEGSCLVDGQTYENNSSVPPINRCQVSCKCISSILICDSVTCSPAPSNLENCMPIYHSLDSCCPTYSCTSAGTSTIKSDSHKIEEETTKSPPSDTEENITKYTYDETEKEITKSPPLITEEQTTVFVERQTEIVEPATEQVPPQEEIPVVIESQPETPATKVEPTDISATEQAELEKELLTVLSPPKTVYAESEVSPHEKVSPTEISQPEREPLQPTESSKKEITTAHALETETEATTEELKFPEKTPELPSDDLTTSDTGLKEQETTMRTIEVITESFATVKPENLLPTKHVIENTEVTKSNLPIEVDEIPEVTEVHATGPITSETSNSEEASKETTELPTAEPEIKAEIPAATEKIPEIEKPLEHKTPETETQFTTSTENIVKAQTIEVASLDSEKQGITTPGKLESESITIPKVEISTHPEEATEMIKITELPSETERVHELETTERESVNLETTPVSLLESGSVKYPETEISFTTPEALKEVPSEHEAPASTEPEHEIILEQTTDSERIEAPSTTQKILEAAVTELSTNIPTISESEMENEYPKYVTENILTPEQPESVEHVTATKEIETIAPDKLEPETAPVTTEYLKYESEGVTTPEASPTETITTLSQEITVTETESIIALEKTTTQGPVLTKTGPETAHVTEESVQTGYVTEEISIPEKTAIAEETSEIFKQPEYSSESSLQPEEVKAENIIEPELATEKLTHPTYPSKDELPPITEKGILQTEITLQPETSTDAKVSEVLTTEKILDTEPIEHETALPDKISSEGTPESETESYAYTERVTSKIKEPEVPFDAEKHIEAVTEPEFIITTESVPKIEAEYKTPVTEKTEVKTESAIVEETTETVNSEIAKQPQEYITGHIETVTETEVYITTALPIEVPKLTIGEEQITEKFESKPEQLPDTEDTSPTQEDITEASKIFEGEFEEIPKPTVSKGVISEGIPELITEEIPKLAISEEVPESVTEEISKPTVTEEVADEIPKPAVNEEVHETITEEIPKHDVSQEVPETVTEEISKPTVIEDVAEEIPKPVVSEEVHETITEGIPKHDVSEGPGTITEKIPKPVSEGEADVVTQEIPKPPVSEGIPESITEEIPIHTVSEKIPEAVTEEISKPVISEGAPEPITEEIPKLTVTEEEPEAATHEEPKSTVREEIPEAVTEEIHKPAVSEEVPEAIPEEVLKHHVTEEVPEAVTEEIYNPTISEGISEAITDEIPKPAVSEEKPVAVTEEIPKPTVHEDFPEAITEEILKPAVSEELPEAVTEKISEPAKSEDLPKTGAENTSEPTVSEGVAEAVTEKNHEPTLNQEVSEAVTEKIYKPAASEKIPEAVTEEIPKPSVGEGIISVEVPEVITEEIPKHVISEGISEAITEEIPKPAVNEGISETITEEILKPSVSEGVPEVITEEIPKPAVSEATIPVEKPEIVTQRIIKPLSGELSILHKLTTQAPVSEVADQITTEPELKLNTSELYTSSAYSAETTSRPGIPGELSTSAIIPSDLQPLLTTFAPDFHVTSTTFAPDHHPKEPTKHPLAPEPEEEYHHPGEEDYDEEEPGAFGPGTCRYSGKVYVSAQQIPRDDPCDFCFCFRSDIICLQQSCPPPIPKCHEEPIRGFCCPRYECPVSMATSVNISTTTTTTTTTLPPHFLHHAYKGRASKAGCQIQGQAYKVGDVIKKASGPCLHCVCGGNGQMQCDPKVCSPEPMLRQMIQAAVSRRR